MTEKTFKTPKQGRSEATVGYISEATIQLLDTETDPTFTTNHIAERAGVSIGTIYRYFPDKGAIFRFVVKREIGRIRKKMTTFIETSTAGNPRDFLDAFVAESMTAFAGRSRATHRFRELAQRDPELVEHANAMRRDICGRLAIKLSELDPRAFRPLANPELEVIAEVFKSTMITLGQMRDDREVPRQTRVQLLYGILSAFAIDGTAVPE